MQPRSTAISFLAVLFWLAGAVNVIGALQSFGHLPMLSPTGSAVLADDQIDGWLLAAMAIVSLFLAGGLWASHSWAKRALVAVAALNIFVTLITQFEGGQHWIEVVPGVVINAAILVYAGSANQRTDLNGNPLGRAFGAMA